MTEPDPRYEQAAPGAVDVRRGAGARRRRPVRRDGHLGRGDDAHDTPVASQACTALCHLGCVGRSGAPHGAVPAGPALACRRRAAHADPARAAPRRLGAVQARIIRLHAADKRLAASRRPRPRGRGGRRPLSAGGSGTGTAREPAGRSGTGRRTGAGLRAAGAARRCPRRRRRPCTPPPAGRDTRERRSGSAARSDAPACSGTSWHAAVPLDGLARRRHDRPGRGRPDGVLPPDRRGLRGRLQRSAPASTPTAT